MPEKFCPAAARAVTGESKALNFPDLQEGFREIFFR
jgi:hypothetical protein